MIEYIFVVLISGLVSFAIAFFYFKSSFSADRYISRDLFNNEQSKIIKDLNAKEKEIAKLNSDLLQSVDQKNKEKELVLEEKNKEIIKLNSTIAAHVESIENYEKKLSEEQDRIKELFDKNKEQFENLANKILEQKSEKFMKLNKTNINDILKPLGDNIDQFKKSIQEKYENEIKGRTSLEEQIKNLKDLNLQISQDAINLTKALKGDSKTRGDWGELQLEVLLENSGLQKDVNFKMQSSLKDEDGKTKLPDCIISLPEEKNFIIDSKVSLVAYDSYVSAENDDERKKYAKMHIDSIKSHISDLSNKNYQSLHGINPPDYVFMFIPIEPALYVALQYDMNLYNKALGKNIVLVSVTTLISTMRTVSFIWKQENQKNNVIEIARQSGALYDKFVGFIDDLDSIGNSIKKAGTNFSKAKNKLHEGKGNIVKKIETIKKLGAKAEKSIPKELINKSIESLTE